MRGKTCAKGCNFQYETLRTSNVTIIQGRPLCGNLEPTKCGSVQLCVICVCVKRGIIWLGIGLVEVLCGLWLSLRKELVFVLTGRRSVIYFF